MSMTYSEDGKKVRVQGDPTLSRQVVEPKALLKVVDADSWFLVWELGQLEQQGGNGCSGDLTREQDDLTAVL